MTPTLLDFMDDAVCKGRGALFYAPAGELGVHVDFDPGPALALCRNECPVLGECRRWAVEVGEIVDGKAQHGVVAGVAPAAARPGVPTLRRCELESCGRLFMSATASRRYCDEACSLTGRAVKKRAYLERTRGVA